MRTSRIIGLLAVLAVAPAAVAATQGAWIERSRYLMGTLCTARTAGDPLTAGTALDAALDRIARLEDVMTTYRAEGGLARLNRALTEVQPGTPVPVQDELWGALRDAIAWAGATDGLFDPTIGRLIEVWDLRGAGRLPDEVEIRRALAATCWQWIRLDPVPGSVAAVHPGVAIDLGGFGKGYALDAAAAVLVENGVTRALINFGGQVLALGAPVGEPGWLVDVADPRDRSRPVVSLRVRDASVATSGNSERFVTIGGRRYGHLLDPRSGRPTPRTGSMTVVAPTATAADVLATALLVGGPGTAGSLLPPGADYLYLEPCEDGGGLCGRGSEALRARSIELEPIDWGKTGDD